MKGSGTREAPLGYHRRVFRICAEDSPNVILAKEEIALGRRPSHTVILPGVLTYQEYLTRRKTWDVIRQCVGLDGKFYKGASVMMFPQVWLDRAELVAQALTDCAIRRVPKAIGVDPGIGGDKTAIAVVDEYGLVDLEYELTPNTAKIRGMVLFMMRQYNVPAEMVCMDWGGGGKQIADEMRDKGHGIRVVGFGESVRRAIKEGGGMIYPDERIEEREERGLYKLRRSQMFGELRDLLNPDLGDRPDTVDADGIIRKTRQTWAIPHGKLPSGKYGHELRAELEPIKLTYDREGMIELAPKRKKDRDDKRETLTDMVGHSPDLADAVALAVYSMQHVEEPVVAGSW